MFQETKKDIILFLIFVVGTIIATFWLMFSGSGKRFSAMLARNTQVAVTQNPTLATGLRSQTLRQGMTAAPGISPADAPKDPYGQPYIIGDLGGMPVNLPRSVVEFVEYTDTPGWDPQAIKDFRPPVRSYDSKLYSFGFNFNYRENFLYDRRNLAQYRQYKRERSTAPENWIDVGISSGFENFTRYSDGLLEASVRKGDIPAANYQLQANRYYGLEHYKQPRQFVTKWSADRDIFVHRNKEGRVTSFIRCSNAKVAKPPCTHYFDFPPPHRSLHYAFLSKAQPERLADD